MTHNTYVEKTKSISQENDYNRRNIFVLSAILLTPAEINLSNPPFCSLIRINIYHNFITHRLYDKLIINMNFMKLKIEI